MRKSISKLIVAGLSLVLSLSVTAGAQGLVKSAKANANAPRNVVSTEAMAAPAKGAHKLPENLKVRQGVKADNQLATVKNSIFKGGRSVLPALKAPLRVAASSPVCGADIYSDAEGFAPGIYELPTSGAANTPELIYADDLLATISGACAIEGKYYQNALETFWGFIIGGYHAIYDMETWEMIEYIEDDLTDFSRFAIDTTYDPTTGRIYGCFYSADLNGTFVFGYQTPGDFETVYVSEIEQLNSIACDAEGQLYGIDTLGFLYTIDKETGDCTLVGDTGYMPQYLTSAVIDQKTGTMWWTLSDDAGGYLLTVDTTTGEADIVTEFADGDEVCGLYVAAPLAEDNAPAAVEDLAVDFPNGMLIGNVSFRLPNTQFDGESLLGRLEYTITRNGEVINTGEGLAGTRVQYMDVVPVADTYEYAVYATRNDLNGPKTRLIVYLGPDAPMAPAGVTLSYANGVFTAAWDEVTEAVHAGYLAGDIRYVAQLYKNDVMVAVTDPISATSCSFEVAEPADLTLFYVAVTALTDNTTSAFGTSNNVALGAANTPYEEEFDNTAAGTLYTIIDANEDGRTWTIGGSGVVSVGYNSQMPMDDWLITPPIRLQAGQQYEFSFKAYNNTSSWSERIEAAMGTAPTVEGMTDIIVEPTVLANSEQVVCTAKVTVAESGSYYFGLHGISDADQLTLYVDYIKVSAGISTAAPTAPAVTITPDRLGALNAAVTVEVPATTIAGDPTEINKVVISRDGEVINENDAVAAGETYTFDDTTVPYDGYYTYTVVAYNAVGAGEVATVQAYVGVGVPAAPQAATVVETANQGEVTISWEAPETDVEGNYLAPENVVYYVVDGATEEIIADGISETTITYQAVTEGQDFVYYVVYAGTVAGVSEGAYTDMIPVGEPYTLPMEESFNDAGLSYIFAATNDGASWNLYDNDYFENVFDFDATNGFAALYGSSVGASGSLITGKITLDAEVPVLSFSYFNVAESCGNTMAINVLCDGVVETVWEGVLNGGAPETWTSVLASLDAYAGKTVQVAFTGTVMTHVYIIIDAIKIAQPADYDLAAGAIVAPATVKAGTEFTVSVGVKNVGAKAAADYKVALSLNGEVVATVDGTEVAPFDATTVEFTQTLSPLAADDNVYTAEIVFAADEVTDNNTTGEAAVDVIIPNYPAVNDLAAQMAGESVSLTWSEPDLTNLPLAAVTEDFESYEPFQCADLGEWLLVDEDGKPLGGNGDFTCPVDAAAYYILNYVLNNLSGGYEAHSGEQYLAASWVSDSSTQSDWLISPAILEGGQTISFFARSLTTNYGAETFEVLYSSTDREVDSFEVVLDETEAPAEWTEYTVELPADAKYFAIRCTSTDHFMFFLDDVTYTPANAQPIELSLVGYNIYRNGVKINDEPVAETSYVDAEGSADDVYVVTVVYAEGESAASNEAKPATVGVDGVAAANVTVTVVERTIVVAGAEGMVSVYAADGKMLYNSAAAERNTVTVAPGVYVVNAGATVKKVVVK